MFTRPDLRELAVLTALGAVLGLVHLVLRPGLPVFAAPAAACTADLAQLQPEPLQSEPLQSELPEVTP